jgi:hypothetical protein
MQQSLAVEFDQPPLYPPPSSSGNFAPGLRQGLSPWGINPPDRFWMSVARRAMVKLSSAYFSNLFLFSIDSHQYFPGVAPRLAFATWERREKIEDDD